MQKTAFEKYIGESFSVFHQLWRLSKAPKQAFNFLFDKNHLPKAETWCIAGGILFWIFWAVWLATTLIVWATNSDLVIESFLIKGDFIANGRIDEALLIAIALAVYIFLFGRLTVRLLGYCYLPLSLLLLGVILMSKTRTIYWSQLTAAAIICPVLAVFLGKKDVKIIWDEGSSRLETCTWKDWINPDMNEFILFLGYPMLLVIGLGGLIINIIYHKYKPEMDKNWSDEGLDSHLLDGDADN